MSIWGDLKIPKERWEFGKFEGPVKLLSENPSIPNKMGVYFIITGNCVAYIGESDKLRNTIQSLAQLEAHPATSRVLCAAHCSKSYPMVWWQECPKRKQVLERMHERFTPNPFPPDTYQQCKKGQKLRDDLIKIAGKETWEAGYIDAIFEVGVGFNLLFEYEEFDPFWKKIKIPPGPWRSYESD